MGSESKHGRKERLLSELLGEYSKPQLIAYWEGRLGEEESRIIDADMDHNPELRRHLADIVEELFDEPDEVAAFLARCGAKRRSGTESNPLPSVPHSR
jgi:hypothetical protein